MGQTTFRHISQNTNNTIYATNQSSNTYGAHPINSSLGISNGFNIALGGRLNFAKQGKLGFTYGLFYNFFAQNYGRYAAATITEHTPLGNIPYSDQIHYYSHFYGFYLGGVWNFWQREGSLAGIYFNVLIGAQSSLSKYTSWAQAALLTHNDSKPDNNNNPNNGVTKSVAHSITNYQMALEGGLRYKLNRFNEFQVGLRVFFLPQNIITQQNTVTNYTGLLQAGAYSNYTNHIQVYPNYAFNINYIMNFKVSK